MKKHFLRCFGGAVLAAGMLLLSGCDEAVNIDVHLTYDSANDALVSADGAHDYRFASVSYEPAYVGDAYADWDDIILYAVDGFSPDDLLTEAWGGIGSMVYAADKPLPTLKEMEPDRIMVCTTALTTTCISEIVDLETVTEAVYYLTTGEAVTLPENGTESYSLKFCSADYEGLYYNIIYISVGDGEDARIYLYDRGDKKCVEVPYEVFLGSMYFENEDTVAESGISIGAGEESEIDF